MKTCLGILKTFISGCIEEVCFISNSLVEIKGKPMPDKSYLLPRVLDGEKGYEYLVPYLLKAKSKAK